MSNPGPTKFRTKTTKLAQLVREETDDGLEIVEKALTIIRGTYRDANNRGPATKDVIDALKLLLDRGWGLPKQEVELSGGDGISIVINRVALSEKEMRAALPAAVDADFKVLPVPVLEAEFAEFKRGKQ